MSESYAVVSDKGEEPDPYLVLGHLASTVVHHVINTFSTIVSQAEILKAAAIAAGVGESNAVARADVIVKAALEGSTVARGLADFSRKATAVAVGGTADPVDLNQLVIERLNLRRDQCQPNVELVADLTDTAELRGDESHLRVMLDCLLDNACESLPPEGGTVTVTTAVDPHGWLILEVRDTGSGMDDEVLQRALEPFFSTKFDHPGLGLALARGIWRCHRGAFSIDSVPGHGTLVRLSCPPLRGPTS